MLLVQQEEFRLPSVDPAFRHDVLMGLSLPQKAVPARWFYDHRGSELFEEITRLPEYYPTRVETDLLRAIADDVADAVGPGRAVVEFGAGSSTKTPLLLSAIAPCAYVPIDISGDFLRQSSAALGQRFPGLTVIPVEADFMDEVPLPSLIRGRQKLGFFPGSTIGNMVPSQAVDLLRTMRASLGEGAMLLIGMDRIKDAATLQAAYDDAAGVTAQFNLNLLYRINRELRGDIPVEHFAHRAIWNARLARIEMHLEAQRDMDFEIDGRHFHMDAGETIHSENSHKYGDRDAGVLLSAGGWTVQRSWTDAEDMFSVYLAEALPQSDAP